jgi:LysR family transcriptional regulator, regulator of abg operon
MKLHQLEALVALVEKGSIRGAARALGITQPSLSARIAELEEEVGATLANRTAHGTTLTDIGKAALVHARLIQNHVRRAERHIAQLTNRGVAEIAIGASPLAEMEVVAPLLRSLHEGDPGAQLSVIEGQFHENSVALREGALDLVIAALPPGVQSGKIFHFEELVTYPMHVVARSGHPHAKTRRLAALSGAQWIVGAATSTTRSILEALFHAHGLPRPAISIHADTITMVQAGIAASDLLGLLPRPLFQPWSQLESLSIEDAIPPLRLGLVTLAATPLTPVASRFANLVRERSVLVAKALAAQRRT